MSLKFTKFKKNNNHNTKKSRKYYKKTKNKIVYGGAKSGTPKSGKVKSLATAYEQKLSKTQTNTKTPRPKTGLLSSFRMSTQKAKAQESQAQPSPQQKSKAPSFLSRLGSSFRSFGGVTLGEHQEKH
jgi:hypothetical protein